MNLDQVLRERGFSEAVGLACDGQMKRFGDKLSGWFIGKQLKIQGKDVVLAHFGDWRAGQKYSFTTDLTDVTPEQMAEIQKQLAENEAAERAARERMYNDAAAEATRRWSQTTANVSPYFERKGVGKNLFGCRMDIMSDKAEKFGPQTIVPARDANGKLWGLQRIGADGFKSFQTGMKIRGCFHLIGGDDGAVDSLEPKGTLYVCEGVATGASVHLATGRPVACAFNAGNLEAVCRGIYARRPDLHLVVCADDDRWTQRPSGESWNPGREYAERAAAAVGGTVRLPLFSAAHLVDARPTDFNDLHNLAGLEAVLASLTDSAPVRTGAEPPLPDPGNPTPPEQVQGSGGGTSAKMQKNSDSDSVQKQKTGQNETHLMGHVTLGEGHGSGVRTKPPLVPMAWRAVIGKNGPTGKMQPPSDQEVANALMERHEGEILKQDRDLFQWTGTHWRHLDAGDIDDLHNEIQTLLNDTATAPKLKSIFELFVMGLPKAPVNMFEQAPDRRNFLNGTLHAVRGAGGKYKLEFRHHNRADYLTSVIPMEFDTTRTAKNEEFEQMLDRVFQGDADKAEKIRAVRQMYGACIMPIYPRLFLVHGPQGSGKSSLIIPAQMLVHQDNWSSVEPHEFQGFQMEDLVGRLVNIVTDINIRAPIEDAHIKKIEDRLPVRIERKYQKSIKAPLPAVHIFGANGIPPTLDGSSGAHTRRWTFLRVDRYRATDGVYRKFFANEVFEKSPQGILNFALQGLEDILDLEGHYTNPGSGKKALEAWQRSHDPVGQFLWEMLDQEEVESETRLYAYGAGRIKRGQLWELFLGWNESSGRRFQKVPRNRFYDSVREKGYQTVKVEGGHFFVGLSVEPDKDASF